MAYLVKYTDEGKIKGCMSGPMSVLEAAHADPEINSIFSTERVSNTTHYVSDGSILPKGEQPSNGHIFNYSSGEWELDLNLAKSEKWAEIKYQRERAEFNTFVWNGYTFDCNEVSQRRIQGAVQLAALDFTVTMDWTLADNTVQTFNATELQQIGQALAAHVNACHVTGREKRAQIDAATTEAELDAIVW